LSPDAADFLLDRHLSDLSGVSDVLRRESFDESCRILMNRSTVEQTSADADNGLAW
jgi:hypothetical protein